MSKVDIFKSCRGCIHIVKRRRKRNPCDHCSRLIYDSAWGDMYQNRKDAVRARALARNQGKRGKSHSTTVWRVPPELNDKINYTRRQKRKLKIKS